MQRPESTQVTPPSERSACVRACSKARSVRSPSPPETFLLLPPPCVAAALAPSASASVHALSTNVAGTGSAACLCAAPGSSCRSGIPALRPRPFTYKLLPASDTGLELGLGLGPGLDQGPRPWLCAAACCAHSASRVCARLAATPGLRQRSVRSSCPTLAARQAQCASRSRLAAARATCPTVCQLVRLRYVFGQGNIITKLCTGMSRCMLFHMPLPLPLPHPPEANSGECVRVCLVLERSAATCH